MPYSNAQKAMRIDGVIFALTGAASALRHGRPATADWKIDAAIAGLEALRDPAAALAEQGEQRRELGRESMERQS